MTIELRFKYSSEAVKTFIEHTINELNFYIGFADESDSVAFIDDQAFIPFFLYIAERKHVILKKQPDATYNSEYHADHILEVTV